MKTTQQYYATVSETRGALVQGENTKQYALSFPEGLESYKLVSEKLNVLDIIPYSVTNDKHPLVLAGKIKPDGEVVDDITMYYEHRNINEHGDSVICNAKTFGKRCPICEERKRIAESLTAKGTGDWHSPQVKALAPKARVMMNVIDWNARDKGIQVFTGSDYIIRQGILGGAKVNRADENDGNTALVASVDTFQLDIQVDWKTKERRLTEYLYFASPTNGLGIGIKCKQDQYEGHDFAKPISFEMCARKMQYPKDIVNKAIDLISLINIKTYDEVQAMFFGTTPDKENNVVETNASVAIDAKPPLKEPMYTSTTAVGDGSPVYGNVSEIDTEKIALLQARAEAAKQAEANNPTITKAPNENLCSYGHVMGKDWETNATDCTACIDNDMKQYRDCLKKSKEVK